MKSKAQHIYKKHRHLTLYGLIGLTGAALDFILYILFYRELGIPPTIASFLSVSIGIANNFFWNNKHNFKKSGNTLSRFGSFYVTGLGGAVLSVVIIFILFNLLGMNAVAAKLITVAPVVLLQYLINKNVSFSDDPNKVFRQLQKYCRAYWLEAILVLIAAIFFFSSIFYLPAFDDMDNMLGGKLLLEGSLPYKDFFSHHAPGMYFISALIYPFTQGDIFIYRFLFNTTTFALLLTTTLLIRKYRGRIAAYFYLLLASIGHLVAFSHLPLGEALVAQLLPLAIVLTFMRPEKYLSLKKVIALSLVLFVIPFVSLAYIFAAGIIYLYIIWIAARASFAVNSLQYFIMRAVILILPYIAGILFVIASGMLASMHYDLFTFNTDYYAPMVGEQGGRIIKASLAMILSALSQISTVGKNFTNADYLTQVLLLFGFLFFSLYLWREKRRAEAVLVPLLLITLAPRANVFNKPAIESSLPNLAQHAAVYIGVAFLASTIGALGLIHYQKPPKSPYGLLLRLVPLLGVVLISFSVLHTYLSSMQHIFVKKDYINYYNYSKDVKESNASTPINEIIGADGSAWIGPGDFQSQLYLKSERATKFTFYLPWIDSSPKLRSEFLNELNRDKPAVIFFSGYKLNEDDYKYIHVQALLDRNYFSVSDPKLKSYYFINSDKDNILRKLVENGYETDQ